ncbi:hypothetical protein DEM27_12425 [Metarhizobium album]|uniref:Uncharacterized protein n=1 Tax=Metarhizobium album TaxID=2182425 RepID=A0A2U2DSC6_9HYPH|nr:hypothetical protein [Rhizobium album]PWE56225.1 hypothetical protein DEM27_12425 [Rhizobium album]
MRIRIIASRNAIRGGITYHAERQAKFLWWTYWTYVQGSLQETAEEAERVAREELKPVPPAREMDI